MASKRPSAADTIFPPKKRALYEHMKLHGIDKYSPSEISANAIIHYQEDLSMCGMKVPVNIDLAQSENYSRRRSDSLHSHVSSNSDNTETGSSGSRETSPCTIQSMFDHQTPERNPITSLDGLKSDILKPLFPPSDSDSSMVDSEEHLTPDISMSEQDRIAVDKFREEITSSKEIVDCKSIPEIHNNYTFLDNKSRKSDSFKDNLIPNEVSRSVLEDGENHTLVKQKQSEVYMGPMVSLLNRFNAEVPQSNVGLKMKDQFSPEDMKSIVQSKSSLSQGTVVNSAQSLPLTSNPIQSQTLKEKIHKVPNENRSCHICNKDFTSKANLHNHMKSHENKSISCWVCKEKFQSADSLNAHMKIEHKGENPYKCEHCSREFTQFNNLRRHMRVHREKVFKCNLCNREFNEEFYLKMHMGTHTGKRVYSCGVCGAGFPSSHDLKMHVKTHSPSLLHTCDVCGKSFSKACVLRQHKKGHSGERPHKCDKCEKTFIHRHHLTMHMKSHVDDKRLSCNICQKEFSQHSHLYKHLRAHEDMKKYGIDLDTAQNMKHSESNSVKKKDISKSHQVNHKSLSKAMNQDHLPPYGSEITDKHSRKRERIGSGETQKQRKRYVSNDLQQQNVGIAKAPVSMSSSSNNKYHLPSIAQTFTHQMVKHPSMQYSQDVSQNYLSGSPASHFSPLFSPVLRNRVPSPLHGYQSYNQLYRNYSEQMQMYYNNMYMMQYMAQNALLQKGQVEGQTLQNNQESFLQKQNECKTDFHSVKSGFMEPKIIEGVERFETKLECGDGNGVQDEVVQSDSDDNSELDVVTATDDQDQEKTDLYTHSNENSEQQNKVEIIMKERNVDSEEHEIAQELLKMSAGLNKAKEVEERERIKMQEKDMENGDGLVKVVNFAHCVNDIIERTIRTSNITDSICTPKSQITNSCDTTTFDNVARLQDQLSVTIPKSMNQSFEAIRQDQQKSVQGESAVLDINRNSESQASPLQKLEMFVTSEYNDFNRVEAANESKETVHNFHGYLGEEITKLESVCNENDPIGNLESDYLGTGENFVKLLKVKNKVKEVKKASNEATGVEDGLQMRLDKIKQFADIGMKYGNSVNESIESKPVDEINGENKDEGNPEHMSNDTKDIENNKGIESSEDKMINDDDRGTEENGNDCEGIGNTFENAVSDEVDPTNDMRDYFDDSLEDRHLEIVENDSFRGDSDEKHIDDGGENDDGDRDHQKQLIDSEVEKVKESKEELDKSDEGYAFTENEFLTHITEFDDSSVSNENNRVLVVEDINRGQDEEAEVLSEENIKGFVEMKGWEENSEINCNLMHVKNYVPQFREMDTGRSLLELKENYFTENWTENGAIDLRTEKKMNKTNDKEPCVVNTVQNLASQENLPMDLSLSRRWIDNSGNEMARECKNDKNFDGNCENTSPALLSCGLCRGKFSGVQELQSHQIEHAKDIGYHCSICKKSFMGAFELQCHMLKHQKSETALQNQVSSCLNNNLKCIENSVLNLRQQTECSNKFEKEAEGNKENTHAESGERNESGEKEYCCKFCDKTFVQAEQLTEHVAVHNASKKPYVCNICRRAFVHRHNLNRHKMSHNSKSFKCEVCHRSFKESFYLQMHMKTHEEENNHKCQICGENVRKSEIWQHTNQHLGHMTENPTYEQIGNRVKEILHEQDMNIGGMSQKNIASRMYDNGDGLRKTKLNEFSTNERALNLRKENVENLNISKTTDIDSKLVNVFQNKENSREGSFILPENSYQENLRNPGSGTFQEFDCHICKIVLNTKHELENHMGIHSGLRPYVCKTCGRAFKKSKGLKTHEKIHLDSSFKG